MVLEHPYHYRQTLGNLNQVLMRLRKAMCIKVNFHTGPSVKSTLGWTRKVLPILIALVQLVQKDKTFAIFPLLQEMSLSDHKIPQIHLMAFSAKDDKTIHLIDILFKDSVNHKVPGGNLKNIWIIFTQVEGDGVFDGLSGRGIGIVEIWQQFVNVGLNESWRHYCKS